MIDQNMSLSVQNFWREKKLWKSVLGLAWLLVEEIFFRFVRDVFIPGREGPDIRINSKPTPGIWTWISFTQQDTCSDIQYPVGYLAR